MGRHEMGAVSGPAKILAIDDEADFEQLIRQRFRRQIRAQEFEFHFAHHGEEALSVLEREPDVELLLLDINMPVMDGLTLLSELRARQSPVRAIIVSAYGDMANIRTAMNRGAFDFVTKPVDLNDLELTMRKTLDEIARIREIDRRRAAAERARVNLAYCRITAPIGGRIGKSSVTAGALVTANQTAPLATVQQLDPIYVDVSQSSSEWLRLRREAEAGKVAAGGNGMPVELVLEDGSRYAHPGRLQFSDVTVEESTGSFALRVLVPNPENTLRPGMYVHAVLPEAARQDGVLAPQQGVTRDPKGNATAMVVGPDGKVAQRDVQVSRTIGDQWLVDSGLAAGDRVIVEGLQKVQPGMAVVAVEASPQPAAAAGPAAAAR